MKVNRETCHGRFHIRDVESQDAPRGFGRRKISTTNIVFQLVRGVLFLPRFLHMDVREVRALVHVFVQIHEYGHGEDDFEVDVTVELVNKGWNMRYDPAVFFCEPLEMYSTRFVVDPCLWSDWLWVSIYTYTILSASARFADEVIFAVRHIFHDFFA